MFSAFSSLEAMDLKWALMPVNIIWMFWQTQHLWWLYITHIKWVNVGWSSLIRNSFQREEIHPMDIVHSYKDVFMWWRKQNKGKCLVLRLKQYSECSCLDAFLHRFIAFLNMSVVFLFNILLRPKCHKQTIFPICFSNPVRVLAGFSPQV